MLKSFLFKSLLNEDIFLDINYYSKKYNNSNNSCSLILDGNFFFNESIDFQNSEFDIESNIEKYLLYNNDLKDSDFKNFEFTIEKKLLCDENLEDSDIENENNLLLCDENLEYSDIENL
jgi:hypothetical protein